MLGSWSSSWSIRSARRAASEESTWKPGVARPPHRRTALRRLDHPQACRLQNRRRRGVRFWRWRHRRGSVFHRNWRGAAAGCRSTPPQQLPGECLLAGTVEIDQALGRKCNGIGRRSRREQDGHGVVVAVEGELPVECRRADAADHARRGGRAHRWG